MKRIIIILLFNVAAGLMWQVKAQQLSESFFDSKGAIAIQTTQMDALADTIAVINHRADDIVWSRVVYRVIDMRERQNYQLYFPTELNSNYKSLFNVMINAIIEGIPAYRDKGNIRPDFNEPIPMEELPVTFAFDLDHINNIDDPQYRDLFILQHNQVTNDLSFEKFNYMEYIKFQLKFLTQEVYFFDKHTSRMYSKIIAIAPLFSSKTGPKQMSTSPSAFEFLQRSIVCWFSFDELRPYLAKQFIIPNGNETQRVSFDEFFAQKNYMSYLLGDGNMFNRLLLETYEAGDKLRREQKRIETEILNVELDLWEF